MNKWFGAFMQDSFNTYWPLFLTHCRIDSFQVLRPRQSFYEKFRIVCGVWPPGTTAFGTYVLMHLFTYSWRQHHILKHEARWLNIRDKSGKISNIYFDAISTLVHMQFEIWELKDIGGITFDLTLTHFLWNNVLASLLPSKIWSSRWPMPLKSVFFQNLPGLRIFYAFISSIAMCPHVRPSVALGRPRDVI